MDHRHSFATADWPEIEYFDARANKLRPAQVREFRTKDVLVRETDTGEHWLIAYTAVNLDGVDVNIRGESAARIESA
jgi:hypothetical protein